MHDTADLSKVSDLSKFPELRWLHKYELLPAVVLALICFLVAGWSGLVVGFLWSTVLVYHATFFINSLAHVRGSTRYLTGDDSRNNWILAILTLGEGWHNNHHAYQTSVRQGFRWWEFDLTFYFLKAFSWTGIVWALKTPPEWVLRGEQRPSSRVINQLAKQLVARFDAEQIAIAVKSSLKQTEWLTLLERLSETRHYRIQDFAAFNLPNMPTTGELLAAAEADHPPSVVLEKVAVRACELLLESVRIQLISLGRATPSSSACIRSGAANRC